MGIAGNTQAETAQLQCFTSEFSLSSSHVYSALSLSLLCVASLQYSRDPQPVLHPKEISLNSTMHRSRHRRQRRRMTGGLPDPKIQSLRMPGAVIVGSTSWLQCQKAVRWQYTLTPARLIAHNERFYSFQQFSDIEKQCASQRTAASEKLSRKMETNTSLENETEDPRHGGILSSYSTQQHTQQQHGWH